MQQWRGTAYNRAAFGESKQSISLLLTGFTTNGNNTFNFNMTKKFWIGLAIIFAIALIGVSYQKFLKNPRCAYEGSAITPIYEVDIVLMDKSVKKFCSIFCASQWFRNNVKLVNHVIVTDEIRGNKIDSYMAYFVESELITNETNDNRIHVFQQRQDAITHAEKFHGTMTDDPFSLDE
jgi:hypothetical protein